MPIHSRLVRDLKAIGLPMDEVDFITPKFSKKYYGTYVIKHEESRLKKPRVYVYLYQDQECRELYPYEELLGTAIHEMCHHLQWRNPNYKRIKGVMHDRDFCRMFMKYVYRAKLLGALKYDYKSEAA